MTQKLRSNELNIPSIPMSRFHYNKQTRSLIAECSDFGPLREAFDPITGRKWIHQLYDDACDLGIAIESHKTGRVERFYLDREEVHDGDLVAFHFKPLDKTLDVKVVVYND